MTAFTVAHSLPLSIAALHAFALALLHGVGFASGHTRASRAYALPLGSLTVLAI